MIKAVEATGTKDFRGVQSRVGEVIAYRNMFWALTDSMARNPDPWIGDARAAATAATGWPTACSRTTAYPRVKEIIENDLGSALIYLNSHAVDFKTPELRPLLDRYVRGSNGYDAVEPREAHEAHVGRGRLGVRRPPRAVRAQLRRQPREHPPGVPAQRAWRQGDADAFKGFAEQCLAEYDLDGWTAPDLVNPTDVNRFMRG